MTTTDRLLDAAEIRIRASGYHAMSFRDLAVDLGIKSASVHYHFRRKEDLGTAVVKRYSERFFDRLETVEAPDGLTAMIAVCREALGDDARACLCGVLGAETGGLTPAVARAVAAFHEAAIDWLAARLEGQGARARAVHAVASLQGAMLLAASTGDTEIFDITARGLADPGRLASG